MINSLTLLGSSSGRNAGDAALISGIMESVDAVAGRRMLYEIPTIKPEFVWRTYQQRVRPVSMLPWSMSVKMLGVPTYRSLLRTDLSLVFDAILFDRQLYNPLFNFMSTLAVMLPFAKRKGRKMAFYNVGAGPVTTPKGRAMLRDIAEMMDFITVRDEDSYKILRDLGVKNPNMLVAADAALTVGYSDDARVDRLLSEAGLPTSGDLIAFNVNSYIDTWADKTAGEKLTRERFVDIYAEALNKLLPDLGVPAVFVCTQYSDVKITREIMSKLRVPQKVGIVHNMGPSHFDIKGVFKRVSLLFGMRLHSQILCSSVNSPIVGLVFQHKVRHYYRTLGLEECALAFEDFSAESVIKHVRKGWENRDYIRSVLNERIPVLKLKSQYAAELVKTLDAGGDIGKRIAELQSTDAQAKVNGAAEVAA